MFRFRHRHGEPLTSEHCEECQLFFSPCSLSNLSKTHTPHPMHYHMSHAVPHPPGPEYERGSYGFLYERRRNEDWREMVYPNPLFRPALGDARDFGEYEASPPKKRHGPPGKSMGCKCPFCLTEEPLWPGSNRSDLQERILWTLIFLFSGGNLATDPTARRLVQESLGDGVMGWADLSQHPLLRAALQDSSKSDPAAVLKAAVTGKSLDVLPRAGSLSGSWLGSRLSRTCDITPEGLRFMGRLPEARVWKTAVDPSQPEQPKQKEEDEEEAKSGEPRSEEATFTVATWNLMVSRTKTSELLSPPSALRSHSLFHLDLPFWFLFSSA